METMKRTKSVEYTALFIVMQKCNITVL